MAGSRCLRTALGAEDEVRAGGPGLASRRRRHGLLDGLQAEGLSGQHMRYRLLALGVLIVLPLLACTDHRQSQVSAGELLAQGKGDSSGLLVIVHIPDPVMPIERGKKYEEPLDAALKAAHAGEVTGGGTQMGELKADGTRDVTFADVDVQVIDVDAGLVLLRQKLKELGAPKGTYLHYTRKGKDVEEQLW